MGAPITRSKIADYINTGTAVSPVWTRMGEGFNKLDETPGAQSVTKTYIHEEVASGYIKGYNTVFPLDTDFISSDSVIEKIYEIARDHKTGTEAQLEYLRVDLFDSTASGAYSARKFTVTVEVAGITGNGGEDVHITGNLHACGSPAPGDFTLGTATFVADT